EEKTAELQAWLARREEFSKKAQAAVVTIYARMRPDAAAAQLVAMDEETAAAVLTKLDPRNASASLTRWMQPRLRGSRPPSAARPIRGFPAGPDSRQRRRSRDPGSPVVLRRPGTARRLRRQARRLQPRAAPHPGRLRAAPQPHAHADPSAGNAAARGQLVLAGRQRRSLPRPQGDARGRRGDGEDLHQGQG